MEATSSPSAVNTDPIGPDTPITWRMVRDGFDVAGELRKLLPPELYTVVPVAGGILVNDAEGKPWRHVMSWVPRDRDCYCLLAENWDGRILTAVLGPRLDWWVPILRHGIQQLEEWRAAGKYPPAAADSAGPTQEPAEAAP